MNKKLLLSLAIASLTSGLSAMEGLPAPVPSKGIRFVPNIVSSLASNSAGAVGYLGDKTNAGLSYAGSTLVAGGKLAGQGTAYCAQGTWNLTKSFGSATWNFGNETAAPALYNAATNRYLVGSIAAVALTYATYKLARKAGAIKNAAGSFASKAVSMVTPLSKEAKLAKLQAEVARLEAQESAQA